MSPGAEICDRKGRDRKLEQRDEGKGQKAGWGGGGGGALSSPAGHCLGKKQLTGSTPQRSHPAPLPLPSPPQAQFCSQAGDAPLAPCSPASSLSGSRTPVFHLSRLSPNQCLQDTVCRKELRLHSMEELTISCGRTAKVTAKRTSKYCTISM